MLLHGYHANGGCGLPGDEESSGEKCRKIAKESPERILSRRGLIRGKGKMVIFRMLKHSENGTKSSGSTRRRSGCCIDLIRSYEQKDTTV